MSSPFEQFFDMPQFDYEENKKIFVEHMDFLAAMSNEEHTLYKKWKEVQNYPNLLDKSAVLKARIWTPRDITDKEKTSEDISALQPEIIPVPSDDKKLLEEWLILRVFIHTMEFEQNPGRFLRFLIRDKVTQQYLGVASIGSDIITVSCRDKWIGWTEKNKLEDGRLRNSAIATTIVATQPFGYNFLGGKLVAALMTDPVVRQTWQDLYNEPLVGLTTTSLYGKHSMYQRIPYWKELGETAGKVMLKPDDKVYEVWNHWLQENKAEEYLKKTIGPGGKPASGVKQKIIVMIMQELGLKQAKYTHGFQRGVYYAPFYENTREYLRGEIGEKDLIPNKKLDRNPVEWWLPKASARYETLHKENRLKDGILYYNDIVDVPWEEVKRVYLGEVGR